MLRIGIAGLGFMGMVHYLNYQRVRGVKVAAIATPEPERRAGDWRKIKGNFGPPGERMDLSGVETFATVDEMIDNADIDAVDITLPPSLHMSAAIRALEAGKQVFCEKPIAMTTSDGKKIVKAATKAGCPLLVGHVLPFFPEYAWALKAIRSGKYGQVLGGSFRRVISDPTWLKNYWTADQVGGPMLDLHVHDAHFIRLVFGKPSSLSSIGRMHEGLPEFWHTQFQFESGVTVEATSGTIDQQGRSFDHGFEIHLEDATLVFEFAVLGDTGRYLCPPTLLTSTGRAKEAKLSGGDPMDAFAAELKEVTRCFSSGEPSDILGADLALDAVEMCHAQSKSLASGRAVRL
ncbi:Gfo/Idh/MocA family oxidoreductase [Aeoliella sp. ICT_H6.2]|uniref:Gfo/Idh/MocA family oxidoreductase n=1 Tax=Aeoliella straminimaris TaxID=2954799 RepID=A0A9X2JIY2_9BACT|nr:Gfo/Idh/MocA family oxidoreductase [Aeoliella straminimaris]MCO6044414.1 Gfo/Idh/MocA family oxidoreductase [Aeoliella straminimaris]